MEFCEYGFNKLICIPEKTGLPGPVPEVKMGKRRMRSVDRYDILAEIRRRRSSLRSVSIAAGLSESACCKALATPFPAAEAALADFLNVTVQELWPDRYPTLSISRQENGTNGGREASLNGATDQTSDPAPSAGVVTPFPTRASRLIP